MFRHASLLPLTFLLIFGGCAYLFPSCATIPGCPDGQFLCTNLNCSDPFTDPYNCGGCAEDGGQICGAGMVCVPDGGDSGPGCGCGAADESKIAGACYALRVDSQNCGTVGLICQTNHVCVDGGCTCASAEYLPNDAGTAAECPFDGGVTICVDLRSDPGNCGSCGTLCEGDCLEGSCVSLDAGIDGGPDDDLDAGSDAGTDAGVDGGQDGGEPDAGDGG